MDKFEFRVEIRGPRPPFTELAEHLWGAGVDFDSDGKSVSPEDRNWTELTVTERPDCVDRVDIDPVHEQPLVLKVVSDSHELALRAATFLAAATNGELLNGPPTPLDVPCPACGFITLFEQYGSYDICPVCGWEDDGVQLANPTSGGGANRESLAEAQRVAIERLPPSTAEYKSFRRSQQWRPLSHAEIEDANRKRSEKLWHTHGIVEPEDAYWNRSPSK